MIVIDNDNKIIVHLQGNSSCQHTKMFGHPFLRALKNSVNVESFIRGSQWGGGLYGYRLKFWLFYGYRLIFFSYG